MWGWVMGLLNGPRKGKGTWQTIPEKHIHMLDEMWNEWLLKRYGSRIELERAWHGDGIALEPDEDPEKGTVKRITIEEVPKYTKARVRDLLKFYYEIERKYFREMADYIRKELGAKMLIIGTATIPFLPSVLSQLETDIIDAHAYWDHPRFPRKPWDPHDFEINNESLVANPPCIIGVVTLNYTVDELLEVTKELAKTRRIEDYVERKGISPYAILIHRYKLNIVKSSNEGRQIALKSIKPPYISDTGELEWHINGTKNAYVIINTDRTQAAVGFIAHKTIRLKNVIVTSKTNAAIALTNLENRPIGRGGTLLLVAVARQMNRGQKWREDRRTIISWGKGPVLMEPVIASIKVLFDREIYQAEVYALNEEGRRRNEVDFEVKENMLRVEIGTHRTPWYELRVSLK